MKWNITAFLISIVVSQSVAFVVTTRNGGSPMTSYTKVPYSVAEAAVAPHVVVRSSKSQMKLDMADAGTTVETMYDTVTVDLEDGRDYPIFIGDEFTDVEGEVLIMYLFVRST